MNLCKFPFFWDFQTTKCKQFCICFVLKKILHISLNFKKKLINSLAKFIFQNEVMFMTGFGNCFPTFLILFFCFRLSTGCNMIEAQQALEMCGDDLECAIDILVRNTNDDAGPSELAATSSSAAAADPVQLNPSNGTNRIRPTGSRSSREDDQLPSMPQLVNLRFKKKLFYFETFSISGSRR